MNIAVFASGTGTTLQTLIDSQQQYGYHVAMVVANRSCMALDRAQKAGVDSLLSKDWQLIHQSLLEHEVQLVVLAGFLAIVPAAFCQQWAGRIINIHPSLLPKHGGKGMYGVHVQEAVLAAGDTVAGCTVHYVSADVDGGSIIAQATVPVMPDDTPQTLSLRVQAAEKQLLPQVITQIRLS